MLFFHLQKFDLSNFKIKFGKGFMKKRTLFMTDFQSSYKALLFDKILFCYFSVKKVSNIELS